EAIDGGVRFWVHNPTFMPREAQLQVFNRSFSTKGQGRGLGTYSMKLLTERYLKGKIGFDSSETGGTTFWAWYPATPGE
ncbi:MAG: ATP-binding protein, partial [Chloroflexi bacterium]|nr:ATP-binding protein [Chloroflexota bacterium]